MTSATTQPAFDPQNAMHWANVLHNAARVPKTAPDYDEARNTVQLAYDAIKDLNDNANTKEGTPGILPGRITAFGQGASLGAASQIGDALNKQTLAGGAIPVTTGSRGGMAQPRPGIYPSADTQTNTPYLAAARQNDPWGTGLADLAGMTATGIIAGNVAAPFVAGLTSAQQGLALAGGVGGGMGAVRGAIEPIPGFSRAESAALLGGGGAVVGAVSGYLAGGIIGKLLPIVKQVAKNVKLRFASAPPAELEQLTEQGVRQFLQSEYPGIRPEFVERTVAAWRTGKVSATPIPAPAGPPAAPTLRPGETITPIGPKGLAVNGPAPPASTKPPQSFWEQVFGSGIPRKTTVNDYQELQAALKAGVPRENIRLGYYSRGGADAQSVPTVPRDASPSLANAQGKERQMQIIMDILHQTPPAELPQAIAGFRSLGIPMGGSDADLIALLQGMR